MFRGQYEYALDDKGRLLIPIRFREELGETIILADGLDGQLNVYPKALFDEMEHTVQTAPDPAAFRDTDRMLAAAVECEVDKQGRIIIPNVMRRSARLSGEVVIVGNRDHLEIWNPESWLSAKEQWVQKFRGHGDDYAGLLRLGLRM